MPTNARNGNSGMPANRSDDREEDEDDDLETNPENAIEDDFDPEEYDLLLRLERLESVEEEMRELGVTTLDQVRQRIAQLHRELDEQER